MPDSLTIRLPHPPRACSPNARVHWRAKAKAVKQYRTLARVVAASAMGGRPFRWARVIVRIVAIYPDARRRDADNILAALKAAFDGLADAGVVENDRGCVYAPIEIVADRSCPGVVLTVQHVLDGE